MLGIGILELIIILGVALIVIGPQKFPEMLRAVGKGLAEFKRATNDIRHTVQTEMNRYAEETDLKEVRKTLTHDFGGVKTEIGKLVRSSKSPEETMEKLADAMEKSQSEQPSQPESTEVKSTKASLTQQPSQDEQSTGSSTPVKG